MGGKQTDSVMPRGVAIHGKSLRITFHYKGQRCRESLGLSPTKSNIKYAAGKLAAINHEIKSGVFSSPAHFPESERAIQFDGRCKRSGIRLNALCDEYKVLKYTDIGHAAQRRYDIAFDQCLRILGPSRLIDAIYPEDVMRLRSELLNTRAASTTNHYMAAMRGFLRFAEQNGYTRNNLADELRPAKKSTSDPDPFTLEEFKRTQAACTHESHRNMITLMVYTGMRPGEVSALAWEDIDLTKKTLTVSRAYSDGRMKKPKTDEIRTIQLSPPAVAALSDQRKFTAMLPALQIKMEELHKKPEDINIHPVFLPATTCRNNQFNILYRTTSIRVLWQNIVRRSGIRYRTVYQLRHTFACWNLTAHGNIAFIAKQMGHADYSMLIRVYGRWMENESGAENLRIWESLEAMGHDEKAPIAPQEIKRRA